ncbi:hypothetical protein [Ornithinimicrobium pekingense]|uniref:Uncharacterized protein n=1 Tax=Ornithinimicrobium pekingense TaxID=384677 RepID=A0ABQ2FAY3_9MICO|nr:hypothetical protein [Ornithinimicrobium pekingense]GGK79056.1 hypothetical protein GCM10011509_29490 [Ornithinimicrobium pekingense]
MLPQRQRIVALAAALTVGLTACGAATDDSSPTPAASAPAPTEDETASPDDDGSTSTAPSEDDSMKPSPIPTPDPGGSALPTGPVPDSVLARDDVVAATEDYAERRGVDVADVTVEGFAAVTWSDGSIGCPEPGMMYTQALVPGYQLVLGVDGQLASYHAAEGKPFSYCASPVAPAQTNPST